MVRLLSETPAEIVEFRADPWVHQRTFLTPLEELNRFVSTVLSPFAFQSASVFTDEIVFEPRTLLELFERHSIQVSDIWHFILHAEGQQEIAELLEATLADWVDFIFVPAPQQFVVYADHDEYITFYAPSELSLQAITESLESAGFQCVKDYVRPAGRHRKSP